VNLPETRRTKEDVLLLVVATAAGGVVIGSVRQAAPPSVGLWVTTAAALALVLAATFAFWLGGAARRAVSETLFGEWDAARTLLSAIPDGLVIVGDGRVSSVNRRVCDLVGFGREELLGAEAPFPFWAPEHRHEIEAWHAELESRGEHAGELTFRRRDGGRIRVLVAGRTVTSNRDGRRYVVTIRDVSDGHRRESRLAELAARDPETGLLNRHEFEERLRDAVREATAEGTNVAVVLAEVGVRGEVGPAVGAAVFRRPEALVAVERLRGIARAGDVIARTRDGELGLILPATDASGGLDAVARLRSALDGLDVELTAGVCDLSTAGDALMLYAFADRALASAREKGPSAAARYLVLPRDAA
jgi:PAS domain S-box-containing protein